MTPAEFELCVRRIRSEHMQLHTQLQAAESAVEKAEIQRKMDALLAEMRIAYIKSGPVRN